MYHNIGKAAGFNTVSVESLEEQLEWTRENYRVVPLSQYVRELRADEMEPETCAVTFDDAYLSYRDLALPVMEKLNIPSTLFVPAGLIGQWNKWDEQISDEKLYIMDSQELRALAQHELVEMGSHGFSHRSLGGLEGADVEREIVESKDLLEQVLGQQISLYSFAFGQCWDLNAAAVKLMIMHGYQGACSTRYGRHNRVADLYQLKRIEVRPEDNLDALVRRCRSGLHGYGFKSRTKEIMFGMRLYNGRKK